MKGKKYSRVLALIMILCMVFQILPAGYNDKALAQALPMLDNVLIDFTECANISYTDASIEKQGWALDISNTTAAVIENEKTNLKNGAAYVYPTAVGDKITFDFYVEKDGTYGVSAIADHGWKRSIFSMAVDGVELGSLFSSSQWSVGDNLYQEADNIAKKTVKLKKGNHKMTFTCTTHAKNQGGDATMRLKSVAFIPSDEFTISFEGCTAQSYAEAKTDVDGWALDAENSTQGVLDAAYTKLDLQGARAMFAKKGDKIAFKINVPKDGKYYVNAMLDRAWYFSLCEMTIDDTNLGQIGEGIIWSGSSSGQYHLVEKIGGRPVTLDAGEHTMVISCKQWSSDAKRMALKYVAFSPCTDTVIDFSAAACQKPEDAVITTDGWELDKTATTPTLINENTAIYPDKGYMRVFGFGNVGDEISFKITSAKTGVYDISAITKKAALDASVDCDVLIDGETVGRIIGGSGDINGDVETADTVNVLKSIELKYGEHVITLRAKRVGSDDATATLYISKLMFELAYETYDIPDSKLKLTAASFFPVAVGEKTSILIQGSVGNIITDLSKADEVFVKSADENIAKANYIIADRNIKLEVEGVSAGTTDITVTVKADALSDTVVVPVTVEDKVIEKNVHTVNFGGNVTKLEELSLENHGVQVDLGKTSPAVISNGRNSVSASTASGQLEIGEKIVFKINVPEAGNYSVNFTGGKLAWYGMTGSFYLDGTYIGEYNCVNLDDPNDSTTIAVTERFRDITLDAGVHELEIVRVDSDAWRYGYLFLYDITFTPKEELASVAGISVECAKSNMLLGEKENAEINLKMSDGSNYCYSSKTTSYGQIKVRELTPEIAGYNNGVVEAKKAGHAIFEITALYGNDKVKGYWEINVSNGQMFNFKKEKETKPQTATLATDLWSVNTASTTVNTKSSSYKLNTGGFVAEFNGGEILAIDLDVKRNGIYDVDITGSKISNTGCLAGFWVDDVYLGSYDFSNDAYNDMMTEKEIERLATSHNVSEQLNTVELGEGKHTLYIKRINSEGGSLMWLDRVVLLRADEMPEFKTISIQADSIRIEKGCEMPIDLNILMTNGRRHYIGTNLDGTVDSKNKIEFASSNEDAVTVSAGGVLSGINKGTSVVTADAYIRGQKYTASKEFEAIRVLRLFVTDDLYLYRTESVRSELTATLDGSSYPLADAKYVTAKAGEDGCVIAEIIEEDGKKYLAVTGLRAGNTYVTVSAECDGVVCNARIPVSVFAPTENEDTGFFLDFRTGAETSPGSSPSMAEIGIHGWEINYDLTDEAVTTNWSIGSHGIVTMMDEDMKTAIDFMVKKSGDYALKFYGNQSGNYGLEGDFYIDNKYIGYFNFNHPTETAWDAYRNVELAFNSVSLDAGVHTLVCKARKGWRGKNQQMRFCGLEFINIDELYFKETRLEIGKTELCAGESTEITYGAFMSDGSEHIMGKLINGKEDPDNFCNIEISDDTVAKIENGRLIAIAEGITDVTVTAKVNGEEKTAKKTVVVNDEIISTLSASIDEAMYVGKSVPITILAETNNGKSIDVENLKITVVPDVEGVVSVNGTTIAGVAAGTVYLSIVAELNGKTAECQLSVTVEVDGITSVEVKAYPSKIRPDGEGTQIKVEGASFYGEKIDITDAKITYASSDESIITVSESGWAKPNGKLGTSTITVAVEMGAFKGTGKIDIVATNGKRGGSIYTDEMVKNARANIQKYKWARTQSDSAVKAAEKYLDKEDLLWNAITTQELPRSYGVGLRYDPEMVYCRYCESDLADYPKQSWYGGYGGYNAWLIDPINAPWKIQCPACRRRFPSNDFGKFYNAGIDANGNWSYELAKKNGSQHLTNDLYPEKGEGWGVDDGYGYKTGNFYKTSNGTIDEIHTYIAYYNSFTMTGALFKPALEKLAMAYLYTGEAKYGRVAAIMLDRMADVYPDMYSQVGEYKKFLNNGNKGKVVGNIAETEFASIFGRYYDAIYPIYDDPYVVNYLSEKAKKYNMDNDKSTPALLRENVEDNLLRETYKAVKDGDINGNFGMHQWVLATSAVALDTMPETKEMLDFMMADDNYDKYEEGAQHAGLDTANRLMNQIDRDGGTNEASVHYSGLWISTLGSMSSLLATYDEYNGANIAAHLKYQKMIEATANVYTARAGAIAIGDTGQYVNVSRNMPSVDRLVEAYRANGNIKMAQLAYFVNGNTTEGMRDDIFTKDPEQSRKKLIQDAIDKYGEYDFDMSRMMPAYGFSIVKGGSLYNENAINEYNNQRAFSMIYGKFGTHGHAATLNLGIWEYGLDMSPEFGYPTFCDGADEYKYWFTGSALHNVIMVNDKRQNQLQTAATPLHFDDAGRVKVMDVDAPQVYSETDIYRRTIVSVDVDDDVSYGIDFFRVKGGNEHLYGFHAQSNEIAEYTGFNPVPYKGSYAGENIPYRQTGIASGFSYFTNVKKDMNPQTNEISVDFAVEDYRNILKDSKDLHMRITMLNDFQLSEVSFVDGETAKINNNPGMQKFVLARRSGENLDSTFTTVLEPYKKDRYIKTMSRASIVRKDGKPIDLNGDDAHAVKVELVNGRTDYVIYSSNNQVEYIVDDKVEFQGFVGVASYNANDMVYSYVCDGAKIIDRDSLKCAIKDSVNEYTASVVDFTRDLSLQNYVVIRPNGEINLENIIGRWMYVENDGVRNGVYQIKGARLYTQQDIDSGSYESAQVGDILIDLGDTTLIRRADNIKEGTADYFYNIAPRQYLSIPLSESCDTAPVFDKIEDGSVTAGSKYTVKVNAKSEADKLTYSAVDMPRGASFDAETQTLTWVPDNKQIGEHHFAVSVSDGALESAVHFTVTVYKATGDLSDAPAGANPPTGNDSPSGGGEGSAPSGGDFSDASDDDKTDDKTENNENSDAGDGVLDVPTAKFIDLRNHAWAEEAIYALVDAGVVNGTSHNTYSPANNIKRADFAIMLTRAFKIADAEGETFADVDASEYYAEELRLAKIAGIVNGVGNNNFNPEGEITRQDMMLMLYRALKAQGYELSEPDNSVLAEFADAAEISDYAKDAVSVLVKDGIIAGAQGRINPLARATRAEIAVMLSRVIKPE